MTNLNYNFNIVKLKYDNIEYFFLHIRFVKKEELQKVIGKKIIELRTHKGWSQSDLARACGKDRQAIEKIENGKVNTTIFTLFEISQALEIPLSKIINI